MENLTFKFVVECDQKETGDIRRVTLSRPVSFTTVKAATKGLFGVDVSKFRYIDEDKDRILVASQYELDTAIGLAHPQTCVRLYVELPKATEPKEVIPKETAAAPVPEPTADQVPVAAAVEEPKKEAESKPSPAGTSGEKVTLQSFLDEIAKLSGVTLENRNNGEHVIDVDLGKVLPQQFQAVGTHLNAMLAKIQANIDESVKSAEEAATIVKPSEEAGVYSQVAFCLPPTLVHRNITCDGCGMHPVLGMRYKCMGCADYDLCQECIKKAREIHESYHVFEPMARTHDGFYHPMFRRMHGWHPPCHPRPCVDPHAVPKPHVDADEVKKPVAEEVAKPKDDLAEAAKPEDKAEAAKPSEDKVPLNLTLGERKALDQLAEMGFLDVEKNIRYLRRFNGVIDERLVKVFARPE